MATDKVIIKGIKAFGYHGVFDLEKKSGQDFIVDIEYSYDTSDAIETDDISKAIDYAAISNLVKNIVEGESRNLIEKVADDIANKLMKNFEISWVKVTLHKPHAPVELKFSDIAVVIERNR